MFLMHATQLFLRHSLAPYTMSDVLSHLPNKIYNVWTKDTEYRIQLFLLYHFDWLLRALNVMFAFNIIIPFALRHSSIFPLCTETTRFLFMIIFWIRFTFAYLKEMRKTKWINVHILLISRINDIADNRKCVLYFMARDGKREQKKKLIGRCAPGLIFDFATYLPGIE